jgi:hypothetical protein
VTVSGKRLRADVSDVHAIARSMPFVTEYPDRAKVVYQVGGRSFVFFRNPRPDAVDEQTGERLTDVIVIWVPSEADKQVLLQDPSLPFFTTPHFNGHPSVLVRASELHRLSVDELREVIEDAWLCRASAKQARDWLSAHPESGARG